MSSRLNLVQKIKSTALVSACSVGALFAIGIFKNNEKFYDNLLMPLVRQCPAEWCHRAAVLAFKYGVIPKQTAPDAELLKLNLFGRALSNPVGIAAGFDKHAEAVIGLSNAGFGFVEIGSVTPRPQPGNPGPRVFRLTADQAIINRYGFNSDGHDIVHGRLVGLKQRTQPSDFVLGVNLGKNKTSAIAHEDYVAGVLRFGPIADYLVINVSSPNTPGLRDLQNKNDLKSLLTAVLTARDALQKETGVRAPVVLKLAPDLSDAELKEIATVITAKRTRVDGLIIANTTVERDARLTAEQKVETGGLSGAPLRQPSTILIAKMYKLTNGQVPIIGVGGIFNGQDAYEKIVAGATAVQLYTSLIFNGPPIVQKVKRELAEIMAHNGFEKVQDAIGTNADYYQRLGKIS